MNAEGRKQKAEGEPFDVRRWMFKKNRMTCTRPARIPRWVFSLISFILFPSAFCLLLCPPLSARTILLKAIDADLMAAMAVEGPRHGWLGYPCGYFGTTTAYYARQESGFLFHFPLDKIPKGQRITHAVWNIPVGAIIPASGARLFIWRVLAEWGPGVCYQYRILRPKPVEWAVPGARGNSLDRATKPTEILHLTDASEQIINVTADVELWYTGAAQNYGWLVTAEDKDVGITLRSPLGEGKLQWELRITYEPQ